MFEFHSNATGIPRPGRRHRGPADSPAERRAESLCARERDGDSGKGILRLDKPVRGCIREGKQIKIDRDLRVRRDRAPAVRCPEKSEGSTRRGIFGL